jgi:hypothetical protein
LSVKADKQTCSAALPGGFSPSAHGTGSALQLTAVSLRSVAFDPDTCMLALEPDEDEREAFLEVARAFPTPELFWDAAPSAEWMLTSIDVRRSEILVPVVKIRRFALELVANLHGLDHPLIVDTLNAVRGFLEGTMDLRALNIVRERARVYVTSCGVRGIPRCSTSAAGALAAWHAAALDSVDGALAAVDFAARHDAFLFAGEAASWTRSDDRADEWREDWRLADFVKHHPQVVKDAINSAQRRYADLLRIIVPNPFRQRREVPGSVH